VLQPNRHSPPRSERSVRGHAGVRRGFVERVSVTAKRRDIIENKAEIHGSSLHFRLSCAAYCIGRSTEQDVKAGKCSSAEHIVLSQLSNQPT
jgi:hypothetical protein